MVTQFTKACRGLIDKLGRSIELTNPGVVVYDPVTGTSAPGTPTTATVKAAIINAAQSKFNLEVETGDLVVSIKANEFDPDLSTEAIINGNVYKAISVNEVYAYEDLALYEIQLRKKA